MNTYLDARLVLGRAHLACRCCYTLSRIVSAGVAGEGGGEGYTYVV
jgi:hypothetical protein